MNNLNSISKLKEQVKELGVKKEQAKGRVSQLLETLQNEFGCKGLEEAEELLEEKQKELKKLDKNYTEAMKKFTTKYSAQLNLK